MNSVDHSALDPLVFDYISCAFSDVVNNLWTWVALLTAALSFWTTIRASASAAAGDRVNDGPSSWSPPRSNFRRLRTQVPKSGFVVSSPPLPAVESAVGTPETPAWSPIVCDDEEVMTKGKFVTYYREMEEEVEEEEMSEGGEESGGGGGGGGGEGLWEAEVRLKMREGMGWYRYQDLTEINGNVVRLWDGVRSGDGEISYGKPIIRSSLAIW